MKNICFYFEIHQPVELKRYRFFDIDFDHYYYDDFLTEERVRSLASQVYIPANEVFMEIIRNTGGKFRCAFSISGIALEQFEQYAPEVIESFQELAKTGSVEFLAEPYSHSLSSIFNTAEFEMQVNQHAAKIETLFGKKPTALRNAELIYSDEIGEIVSNLGYKTILIDEAKHIMGWKSPNYVYNHASISKLKLLVRNFKLSDDVAFRFSDRTWLNFPLTAETYINWIEATSEKENVINIWMGYEALGFFNSAYSGIFDFFKALPTVAFKKKIGFATPSEITKTCESAGALSVSYPVSWSGSEKNLASWTGNDLQQEALNKLYAVSERVHLCSDKPLRRDWLILQTSNYFRFMSHTDAFGSNYESPYEAFINYMNILDDFLKRVDAQYPTTIENEELNELLTTIYNQDKTIEMLEGKIEKLKKQKKI
ncbi:MAG: glycoside hydrolase family 57 protein [Prevotellaceae bacterium]|nr:glycoside hydrolase family 57 protein [Prevotellaceae bacterium]